MWVLEFGDGRRFGDCGQLSVVEQSECSSTVFDNGGDGPGQKELPVPPPELETGVVGSLGSIQKETIPWQSWTWCYGHIQPKGDLYSSQRG